MNIGVLGRNDFVLGFQLAGINKIFEITDNSVEKINEVMQQEEIGIVVIDQKIVDELPEAKKELVEESVKPVFVSLSTETSQEGLRQMIKKSIGIDLWSE